MTSIKTTRRGRAALGLAAGLVAAAVAATMSGYPANAATVDGGTVEWGVRQSFRTYIVGPIAGGTVSAGGGATQKASNGPFVFPVGGGSHDGATTTANSSGSAHFSGHHGILEVNISDVRVSINGSTGSIIADVTARPFTDTTTKNDLVTYDDLTLATLNLAAVTPTVSADEVKFTNVPAVLTAQGGPVFAPFYPPGDPLDPVTITLSLGDGSSGPGGPTDPPTTPSPQSDDVELVVVVPGEGGLAISVSNERVTFDDLELSPDAQHLVASAVLGGITVTDTRLTDPGWNVTAQLTDFSGDAATLPRSALGWAPQVIETGPSQTVSPGAPVAPGTGIGGATLASAGIGLGRGTAKLAAELQLQLPTDVAPGEYSAVLTLTAI